jgi:hypothetical protein
VYILSFPKVSHKNFVRSSQCKIRERSYRVYMELVMIMGLEE